MTTICTVYSNADKGSGDYIYIEVDSDCIFSGHFISALDLVSILNNMVGTVDAVKLVQITDVEMEELV